ncbi:ATP phosphoribosyltransferase [Candidatus Uzinura diaspidicola str. ASNER]|uniref:ATP phosphoribosyltransferase n=1 Tax=Candidatus Uzinura diaspidicola str. ASNER TaxID=1133592 RepID=L7VJE7_9FLAO|nr:ATP phosphoribosyltransferase [Candidatus Uzinura diaspidicola str. ASNER]
MKIALQKKGRLHEESINLLKACGINFPLDLSKDKLKISTYNLDIFFLRDDDIPSYIQEGVADIGIVGKNVVFEQEKSFLIKKHLGFGYCRLSFAVPKESLYKSSKDFSGKCIATSYPNILFKFLKEQNICSYIHKISGSVEIAPNIGVADAICDLVSSGSTLDSNDLKEIETIFSSEAVLICHPKSSRLAKKLIFRLQAFKRARDNKYLLLLFNAPNKKLEKIISFLHKSCKRLHRIPKAALWTYIQVIVPAFIIWNILDELKRNSVKDLVVLEKMRVF